MTSSSLRLRGTLNTQGTGWFSWRLALTRGGGKLSDLESWCSVHSTALECKEHTRHRQAASRLGDGTDRPTRSCMSNCWSRRCRVAFTGCCISCSTAHHNTQYQLHATGRYCASERRGGHGRGRSTNPLSAEPPFACSMHMHFPCPQTRPKG